MALRATKPVLKAPEKKGRPKAPGGKKKPQAKKKAA